MKRQAAVATAEALAVLEQVRVELLAEIAEVQRAQLEAMLDEIRRSRKSFQLWERLKARGIDPDRPDIAAALEQAEQELNSEERRYEIDHSRQGRAEGGNPLSGGNRHSDRRATA